MKKDKRFSFVEVEGNAFTGATMVIVDKSTGVNYLFVKDGYGGGITPLIDKDGKPIVTPVTDEQ